jgi:hypothetical protein
MSEYYRIVAAAEDAHRAANRMEQAAKSANEAAERMESVLHQLRMLVDDGYGNNVTRLIELLSKDHP